MKKGQLPVTTIVTIGIGLVVSAVGAFFGLNNKVNGIETRSAVIESKYVEIDRRLGNIEEKLDIVLNQFPNAKIKSSFASSTKITK